MSHKDAPDPDPTAFENWSRPRDRLRAEIICLARTLMPDKQTFERTVATIVIFGVWAVLVLAPLFGAAEPPRYELLVATTAIVFTILGRMWNFEVQRVLNAVAVSADGGQEKDGQNDN